MTRLFAALLLILAAPAAHAAEAKAEKPAERALILATTTSFQDSGLLDVLLKRFKDAGGPQVKPIAVGTGEALALGAKGEADVLVVHAPKAEAEFVAAGNGINRRPLWHSDFVIVGPKADPAKVKGRADLPAVIKALAAAKAVWASRGDKSGTHKKEQDLFAAAEVKPWAEVLSTGQGMGETLRIASEKKAYTLADRGTWLAQKSTLSLEVLFEGDAKLANPYHVIEVSPAKFEKVNSAGAKQFADFLVKPETQAFVKEFGKDKYGAPLFVPDAK